ncbi:MAG: DUF308 domain-containing protein [Bacilli bacterium]|nr:DUF308 domain-containing protein [Bacilli bacterium]
MGKLTKNEIIDYKINNIVRLCVYLVFIIVGLILCAKSYIKYEAIINFLGVLFIITGGVFVYISSREKKLSLSNLDVIFGVLASIDGLLMILNPGNVINNLTFYLGLFIVIGALQKLVVAIKLINKKDDAGIITLATSIFTMLMGGLLILNIFKNTSLTELAGMFIMFYGIIQLANTILLNSKEKDIIKKN